MVRWEEGVERDHDILTHQADALEAALAVDVTDEDRRVVLAWIVQTLWPALELHLRKEEEVFFPAVHRLIGENAGAVTLMQEEHKELRDAHRRLAELLQVYEHTNWDGIRLAAESLMERLEDHRKKERRLILDVLEYSLKSKELKDLAGEFEEVARRAHEEEGWPATILYSKRTASPPGRGLNVPDEIGYGNVFHKITAERP